MTRPTYREFLESKVVIAPDRGLDVPHSSMNPAMKPHAADLAHWAIRGGNRAVFASFGLQKTSIQLQILKSIIEHEGGLGLIVCPLGVKHEFVLEDRVRGFNVGPVYVRTNEELATLVAAGHRYFLTNYERVRDGALDPNLFTVVSLDESSVLRSFGSKTYQTFLTLFDKVRFKYVCTATPDPNRTKELIHYAGFLGVMDTGHALTRFFKRDSTQAGNLQLHPHKEKEFYLWVHTWAAFVDLPSDLGHDDTGYELPPFQLHKHRLPVDHSSAGFDNHGQGKLVRDAALGVRDAAREKRDSLADRITRLKEIICGRTETGISEGILPQKPGGSPGETTCSIPSQLQREAGGLQGPDQTMERGKPGEIQRDESRSLRARQAAENRAKSPMVCTEQTSGEGEKSAGENSELRPDAGAIPGDAGQSKGSVSDLSGIDGFSPDRSRSSDGSGSGAALSKMQHGTRSVPGRSDNHSPRPGIPQFIVWCDLNDEQRAVERALQDLGINYTSLDGKSPAEERELQIERWKAGETTAFVGKPVMYGAGVNLQQCHIAIFIGIGYKFQDFIQAIHRIFRFGQKQQVEIHLIYTESEDGVYDVLMSKWERHKARTRTMTEILRKYGLNNLKLGDEMQRSIGVEREEEKGEYFTAAYNDNVLELETTPDNSVDLIVSSWPFSDHYEYCESFHDFGHNDGDVGFFEQMEYLTPETMRVLKPGRMYCVHAKDRVLFGSVSGLGMYSFNRFSDKCADHMEKHGFIFCGRITIVTDVVRENNQTYRLGWTENEKDGTKMGVGSSEYVLVFRKLPTDQANSYADEPVRNPKPLQLSEDGPIPFDKERNLPIVPATGYSRSRWQFDAHAFWRSAGNRFLRPEEIKQMPLGQLRTAWQRFNESHLYDFREHVQIAEELEAAGKLPGDYMLLDPRSHNPWVWDDVVRMRTLNCDQARGNREQHVCPLQFDIVERLIERYSNPGDLVMDPFGGLGTVGYCAIQMRRRAFMIELNHDYWKDSLRYLKAAEQKLATPTLFDLLESEDNPEAAA